MDIKTIFQIRNNPMIVCDEVSIKGIQEMYDLPSYSVRIIRNSPTELTIKLDGIASGFRLDGDDDYEEILF